MRTTELVVSSEVSKRVYHEVLGDGDASRCRACGAALEGNNASSATNGLLQCTYCGAVARLDADDPWLAGLLAMWKHSERDLAMRGKLDTAEAPTIAISLVYMSVTSGTGDLSEDDAMRGFARLIPWVSREMFLSAIDMIRDAFPRHLPQLRARIAASWTPNPAARPVAEPTVAVGDPEAWITQQLAYLRTVPVSGPIEMRLILTCIAPFQMGSRITPETALAFMARAEPSMDRQAARTVARQLMTTMGPEVAAFLDAVARGL